MKNITAKIAACIFEVSEYFENTAEKELSQKPSPEKWSKKEILGHLIDSAINNLQRFTEVQFSEKPYVVRPYAQDALVKANVYNMESPQKLLMLWEAINERIMRIIDQQNSQSLAYPVMVNSNIRVTLSFLIEDYVQHMVHHVRQIVHESPTP